MSNTFFNRVQQCATLSRYDLPQVAARPVFYPELGNFFRGLREAKKWGLRQTAQRADSLKLEALTKGTLFLLEKGKIKDIGPDVLRDAATLYGQSYDDLVRIVVRYRYGANASRDLGRHSAVKGSAPTLGGADVPASENSVRAPILEERIKALEAALDQTRDVARQLIHIAAVGQKGHGAAGAAAGPSRRRRKTG